MKQRITLHWFRRDLRLTDNAALYHALKQHNNVLPLFIFDTNILDDLEDRADARVTFIYDEVIKLKSSLEAQGSSLIIAHGRPEEIFADLTDTYHLDAVYTNRDYEPYATARDSRIYNLLKTKNIPLHTFKDQVIFEKDEVVKDDGSPYAVFTPYSKKWRSLLDGFQLKAYSVKKYEKNLLKCKPLKELSLAQMGFERSDMQFPSAAIPDKRIANYNNTRDYPGIAGTSRLGMHLRFGTISIRRLTQHGMKLNAVYVNELIWREFYHMILWHFPQVVDHAFKPEYDNIRWRNNEKEFALWCNGQTGYPLVDAGMRELNATGFMHNRVRMVTASFLTKHLLIDWRWGEAYFAKKLLDYDLASNNGGWQWAAGTGVDAAPYFRIFNPEAQLKKFDADLAYVRKWVPEFEELNYPPPIVEHVFARQRCLQVYKQALAKTK